MNTNKEYQFEAVTKKSVIFILIFTPILCLFMLILMDLTMFKNIKGHSLYKNILTVGIPIIMTLLIIKLLRIYVFSKKYRFLINNESIFIYSKKISQKITIDDLEQVKLMSSQSLNGGSITFLSSDEKFILSTGYFVNNKSNFLKMELFFNKGLKPFLLENKFKLNDKIEKNHIEFILSKNH